MTVGREESATVNTTSDIPNNPIMILTEQQRKGEEECTQEDLMKQLATFHIDDLLSSRPIQRRRASFDDGFLSSVPSIFSHNPVISRPTRGSAALEAPSCFIPKRKTSQQLYPTIKEISLSQQSNVSYLDQYHHQQHPYEPQPQPGSSVATDKRIALYKTEMCRTFEETGTCRYGAKCQFAHDASELRRVPRHPRYKTEICKTFWQLGNCPYGKRCCFIHTENELQEKELPSSGSFKKEGNLRKVFKQQPLGASVPAFSAVNYLGQLQTQPHLIHATPKSNRSLIDEIWESPRKGQNITSSHHHANDDPLFDSLSLHSSSDDGVKGTKLDEFWEEDPDGLISLELIRSIHA